MRLENSRRQIRALFAVVPSPAKDLAWPIVAFLLVSFFLRVATFGDPNLHPDEAFYFQVGLAMHDGALPYVDVWDRKPFGLFALYYLFAAFSGSVVSYQIAAWLFAAGTATAIYFFCRNWIGNQGALFAGTIYLFMLGTLHGFGGQAPVFYNLFIAIAALLVREVPPALRSGGVPLRLYTAMLLCGVAITIKQTALFESLFLGLIASVALLQSSLPRKRCVGHIVLLAIAGAAPTLAISTFYWLNGHWHEYWHAMVISNLAKEKPDFITAIARSVFLGLRLDPLLCLAALGLLVGKGGGPLTNGRGFVAGWLFAAFVGLGSVPNFYLHYALPLLVPLCVAASPFLARRWMGPIACLIVVGLTLNWIRPLAFDHAQNSRHAMTVLTQTVRDHDSGGGLLVFDGPPLLYALSEKPFPSPLVFPMHFNHGLEKDVSHLNTHSELVRVLKAKPGVVVLSVFVRNKPSNKDSIKLIRDYVFENCRLVEVQNSVEMIRADMLAIYGDCHGR